MLLLGDIHEKQRPGLSFVLSGDDCLEKSVDPVFGIVFLAEPPVTADNKEDGKSGEQEHHPMPTVVHCGDYDSGSDEGCAGSQEPTTDDGNHARDAEHRALAPPCSVGEGGTHRNHEGDECSRKG